MPPFSLPSLATMATTCPKMYYTITQYLFPGRDPATIPEPDFIECLSDGSIGQCYYGPTKVIGAEKKPHNGDIGVMVQTNGWRYEGWLEYDERNGYGMEFDEKGNKSYEGWYKNTAHHGYGVTYVSGLKLYEGWIEDSKRHGFGRSFNLLTGAVEKEGLWQRGEYIGPSAAPVPPAMPLRHAEWLAAGGAEGWCVSKGWVSRGASIEGIQESVGSAARMRRQSMESVGRTSRQTSMEAATAGMYPRQPSSAPMAATQQQPALGTFTAFQQPVEEAAMVRQPSTTGAAVGVQQPVVEAARGMGQPVETAVFREPTETAARVQQPVGVAAAAYQQPVEEAAMVRQPSTTGAAVGVQQPVAEAATGMGQPVETAAFQEPTETAAGIQQPIETATGIQQPLVESAGQAQRKADTGCCSVM